MKLLEKIYVWLWCKDPEHCIKLCKEKSIYSFVHKVDRRKNNLVVVTTYGEVGAVQAITFGGHDLNIVNKVRSWEIQRRFPFLVRREHTVAYKVIKPRKEVSRT